jgi:hypothetical protein
MLYRVRMQCRLQAIAPLQVEWLLVDDNLPRAPYGHPGLKEIATPVAQLFGDDLPGAHFVHPGLLEIAATAAHLSRIILSGSTFERR